MIDTALQILMEQRAGVAKRVNPATETAPVSRDLPRIIYTLIDDPAGYTDSGPIALGTARYQIDVFGRNSVEARSVILQLQASATADTFPGLDGFRGTVSNTLIHRIYFGSTHIGLGANVPGQAQSTARATVDAFVVYRELLTQPNFT